MLNKIFLGVAIVVVTFAIYVGLILAKTKIESPPDSVSFSSKKVNISIDYSRPYKKGRKIFGGLVPYGKYWRTGANEATQITFDNDVLFAGEMVRAGTYWLYTIPNEDQWTVALNEELGAWGIPGPDNDKDVIQVQVSPLTSKFEFEQFTISFSKKSEMILLKLNWDQTLVQVPIQ